jgi:23S rRNA (adenine-N6)-dimethyltransferase
VRTVRYAQNFLLNSGAARRLVYEAGGPAVALRVDLGAGKGVITEAALQVAPDAPVLAVEVDPRLAEAMRRRYGKNGRVEVVEADLVDVAPPLQPFVCIGNPPFNLSTHIARHWLVAPTLCSGALIVEREFGQRLAGRFGTTKLSASLGASLEIDVPLRLSPSQFHPRPRVNVAIMTFSRRSNPVIEPDDIPDYWLLVNFLFESGRRTVGEALGLEGAHRLAPELSSLALRDAAPPVFADLLHGIRNEGQQRRWRRIVEFDQTLAPARRALQLGANEHTGLE